MNSLRILQEYCQGSRGHSNNIFAMIRYASFECSSSLQRKGNAENWHNHVTELEKIVVVPFFNILKIQGSHSLEKSLNFGGSP